METQWFGDCPNGPECEGGEGSASSKLVLSDGSVRLRFCCRHTMDVLSNPLVIVEGPDEAA